MKKTVVIETTVTLEVPTHCIREFLEEKSLIDDKWKGEPYSVDVKGLGVSRGMILTIKKTESKNPNDVS